MAIYRGSGTPTTGENIYSQAELDAAVAAAAASEAAAAASEAAALAAQTAAEVAETGATVAQTAAEAAQTAAETAQTAAELAQTNAETAETNAETAETNAETAETNAGVSETNAAASAAAAAASAATNNLPALTSGDVGKNIKVNATWDGYEFDVTIPHTDTANTFAAKQTIELTGETVAVQYNRTDAGNLLDFWALAGSLKWLQGVIDSDDSYILKNAAETGGLIIDQDAKILDMTATGITYDGENVLTEDRQNILSKKLVIETVSPVLLLNENDQTDKNWGFFGTAGNGYIGLFNDAGVNTTTVIRMAPTADQLYMTAGDIEYDGNTIRSYCGRTDAAATGYAAPDGWSIAKIATGHLRITHNLNAYPVMVATPEANAERHCTIVHSSLNAIDIYTRAGATLTDTGVSFMCQGTS